MAFAEDLLEQAYHLARRERTKPRQASLRRAIFREEPAGSLPRYRIYGSSVAALRRDERDGEPAVLCAALWHCGGRPLRRSDSRRRTRSGVDAGGGAVFAGDAAEDVAGTGDSA